MNRLTVMWRAALVAAGVVAALPLTTMQASAGSLVSIGGPNAARQASGFTLVALAGQPTDNALSQKQIQALVPKAIRERGILRVAGDPGNAPLIFKNSGGWTGSTYELMAGVAKELNLKLEYLSTAYGNLVTLVQAGRVDASAGALTDTPARRKAVIFVDFEKVWHQLLVQAGNPLRIHSIEDTCGKIAGAPIGGLDGTIMEIQAKKCIEEGKPALTVKSFQGSAASTAALASGRVDVIAEEYAAGKYGANTIHVMEQIPGKLTLFQGLHGVIVPRTEPNLAKAIAFAIDKMIESGQYAAIYKKYDLTDTMLPHAIIGGEPINVK